MHIFFLSICKRELELTIYRSTNGTIVDEQDKEKKKKNH